MKLADNASLGVIETKGFVGAVAAADAMVKSASVMIFRKHYPGSARVTLMCQGELSACETAVYAGAREAEAVGELIGHAVIGRPDYGAEELCLGCLDAAMARKKVRKERARHSRAGNSPSGDSLGLTEFSRDEASDIATVAQNSHDIEKESEGRPESEAPGPGRGAEKSGQSSAAPSDAEVPGLVTFESPATGRSEESGKSGAGGKARARGKKGKNG